MRDAQVYPPCPTATSPGIPGEAAPRGQTAKSCSVLARASPFRVDGQLPFGDLEPLSASKSGSRAAAFDVTPPPLRDRTPARAPGRCARTKVKARGRNPVDPGFFTVDQPPPQRRPLRRGRKCPARAPSAAANGECLEQPLTVVPDSPGHLWGAPPPAENASQKLLWGGSSAGLDGTGTNTCTRTQEHAQLYTQVHTNTQL